MKKSQNELIEMLNRSNDMEIVQGKVEINVPADEMWAFFTKADLWARWNKCFFYVKNKDLVLDEKLTWFFKPIKWYYFYIMPATAKIVEIDEGKKVTWEVTALPGFYARHTYSIEDLGNGKCRFGSWEKATGWSFRLMKKFWLSHFTFVKDLSLEGAKTIEKIYNNSQPKALEKKAFKPISYIPFTLSVLFAFTLLLSTVGGLWFYDSYAKLTSEQLSEDISVIFGGGGNTVVLEGNKALLLVDTKFGLSAKQLKSLLDDDYKKPVDTIVNTHYHYDHTQGNSLYSTAKIIAQMRARDAKFWRSHTFGVPTGDNLVEKSNTFIFNGQQVTLLHLGQGHTQTDLVVYFAKSNVVALGDLMFHDYYPFMDLEEGGMKVTGLIKNLHKLAKRFPNARFVPGHGPMATAADVTKYAMYLESLSQQVAELRDKDKTVDEMTNEVNLDQWDMSILPSLHGGLTWATQKNNIRWMYDLVQN